MRPFDHIDSSDVRDHGHRHGHRGAAALLCTRFYGGSASSQSNPATLTTSGSSSPITSGSGSSATSGSIALGSGAKYQESGSVDLSQSDLSTNVNASGGATVNVGNTALDTALSQVVSSLGSGGSIPVSLAGGSLGSTTVVPVSSTPASTSSDWLNNINWTLVAIVGGGLLVVFAVLFFIIEEKK